MRELVAFQLVRIAAADPTLDPNIVVPATLTLIGVLGAAYLANRVARRRPKTPTTEVPVVAPSPLSAFSGTQNEFMRLVIKDNEAIRTELAANRTELAGLRTEVAGLRAELEETRASHGALEVAARRYLELLASSWAGPAPMPWPSDDDYPTLDRILPRRPRRTPHPN